MLGKLYKQFCLLLQYLANVARNGTANKLLKKLLGYEVYDNGQRALDMYVVFSEGKD